VLFNSFLFFRILKKTSRKQLVTIKTIKLKNRVSRDEKIQNKSIGVWPKRVSFNADTSAFQAEKMQCDNISCYRYLTVLWINLVEINLSLQR